MGEAMEIDIPMLKATLKYHGTTYRQAADAIGVNRDTFARRLKTKFFTVADVHRLMAAEVLGFDDAMRVFFSIKKGGAATPSKMAEDILSVRFIDWSKEHPFPEAGQ